MSQMLSTVSEHLLAPGGLTLDSLQSVLGELAGPGIDAADLYFQGQISESWALEDGIVKEGSFNLDQGVGVRAQSGEKNRLRLQQRDHPGCAGPSRAGGALDLPRRPEWPRAGLQQSGGQPAVRSGQPTGSAYPR